MIFTLMYIEIQNAGVLCKKKPTKNKTNKKTHNQTIYDKIEETLSVSNVYVTEAAERMKKSIYISGNTSF